MFAEAFAAEMNPLAVIVAEVPGHRVAVGSFERDA